MAHETARNDRGERIWTMVELRNAVERFDSMLQVSDMSRATRFHYVDHSTRFLNWLEGRYAPRTKKRPGPQGWTVNGDTRSKYAPLRDYLAAREDNNAWANDGTGNHTQAAAWLSAGRRVAALDLLDERVLFIRTNPNYRGGRIRYRPEPGE